MKVHNIGNHKSIDAFVENKLALLEAEEKSFSNMFDLMFSEKENVMFEKSEGYKIIKTTYGKVYSTIKGLATTIKSMLKAYPIDSVVGLYMDNSVEWIEYFWAILMAGYRPLLMNLRLDIPVLEEALSTVGAAAVISEKQEFSIKTFMACDINPSEELCDNKVFGSEIFVMSSGTSEHIKLCAYSAEEFYCQINDSYHIIKKCKLIKRHYEGELKLLTFLPFYHVFGLIAVYIWFSFFSRTFVQLNDMAPTTIVNTIRRHKVTHIFAVPMFWEKVYEQAIKTIKERGEKTFAKFNKGLKLSVKLDGKPVIGKAFKKKAFAEVRQNLFGDSIMFMITGGSEISSEVMTFFNGIGYHLADGYGMTEIGITSVELGSKAKVLNSCSVGKPFSSMEYKIAENGELLVRGKAMAKYIIEDGQRKENVDWFHTRDLAECVKGNYRILGRLDDLVIGPSGENLNPNMIEPLFDGVGAKKVCLIADKSSGKALPMLLISVNKGLPTEKLVEIDQNVKKVVSESKFGAQISKLAYTTDALLGDNDFKLKREAISRKFNEGSFKLVVPGQAVENEAIIDDEISQKVRIMFATALGKQPEDIGYDMDFFLECGGTSLDYFALCSELTREFGAEIPVSEGNSLKTVNNFCEFIRSKG